MTFDLGATIPGRNRPLDFEYDSILNVAAGIGYRLKLNKKGKAKKPGFIQI